jgi:uncharacterized membrane protein YuzA (DUF378 family)
MKKELAKGFLMGVIAPIIILYVISLSDYNRFGKNFFDFIEQASQANILAALLSLCAIINLGLFWLFLRKGKYNYCKGIIFGTFPYAAYIIYVKVGI